MTLGRLARLMAIAVVAVAIWRASPSGEPDRVVVMALPGASLEWFQQNPGGSIPLPAASVGKISVEASTPGIAWWRSLFAGHDPAAGGRALWAAPWGAAIEPLHAPARVFAGSGEDATAAFLGSSAGATVDATDIAAGRLPAPWDRAVDAVSSEAASMHRGKWSPWIPIPAAPGVRESEPGAEFQFVRYSENGYFLSPAYVLPRPRAAMVSPFLGGLDADLRPLVALHVLERRRREIDSLGTLFEGGGARGGRVVLFDTTAEEVASVFSPDIVPAAVSHDVVRHLRTRVDAVVTAAGADGLVLVVGGPSATRDPAAQAWFVLFGGAADGAAAGEETVLELRAARAMVGTALGQGVAGAERDLVPVQVAGRIPARLRPDAAGTEDPAVSVEQPWTAGALDSASGTPAGT